MGVTSVTADPIAARPPVSVAVVNDYELVVRGTISLLEQFPDRVIVVETELGDVADGPVDVALFDTFAATPEAEDRVLQMLRDQKIRYVLLYTWDVQVSADHPFARAHDLGVVSKSVSGEQLVAAIEQTARGLRPVLGGHGRRIEPLLEPLSDREAEVLALIAEGHTNKSVADHLNVSAETVKTYASRAYTKLGVKNRTQAAAWALRHGLERRLRAS